MHRPVFEQPHYVRISKRRESWLADVIGDIQQNGCEIQSAIDVGCGQGYFANVLNQLSLDVLGVDGREANTDAARSKYPHIRFVAADVEDPAISKLGDFDLVLCLGLLYHLENPFRALRNLEAITKHVLIGESRIAPSREPILVLYEEAQTEDQGLKNVALIPSETCLLKMLYSVGFRFVYLSRHLPDHPDFRSHLLTARARTCFVASKAPLALGGMVLATNVDYHVNIWRRWWARRLLGSKPRPPTP